MKALGLRQRADRLAHLLKALTQQHHRELLPLFRALLASDGVVIDIGAHAGQFTKLFAGLVPQGRVIAVEPSPYALGILQRVVAWRRLGNVTIVPAGLSDRPGMLSLATPLKSSGAAGFGLASFAGHDGRRPARTDTVPVETLDGMVSRLRLDRIDLIKCDVEGWEVHIVRGGEVTIARHRPALLLEVVAASLARAGETPETVWALLGPLGYRARRLDTAALTDTFAGDGDYLFTSEAKPAAWF